MTNRFFDNITRKESIAAIIFAVVFTLWNVFVVGFRDDHLFLLSAILIAWFASPTSRKVVLSLLFFLIYWIVYDSTRILPNYMVNPVHIKEVYDLELAWFGIQHLGELITPNEYFKLYLHPFLDVISGLFYLCWIPVPLAFALWLFFRDKKLLLQFSFSFFLVNFFGIMVYYLYPAAAPWYVELHGFEENFNIPGSEAGLSRFDDFFGIKLFNGMYAKNANVFAAIPSMHSAFPVITFYFGLKKGLKWGSVLFFIIMLGVWFAAVYSSHHYIIDVILGALCAVLAIVVFEILMKSQKIQIWLSKYVKAIS